MLTSMLQIIHDKNLINNNVYFKAKAEIDRL